MTCCSSATFDTFRSCGTVGTSCLSLWKHACISDSPPVNGVRGAIMGGVRIPSSGHRRAAQTFVCAFIVVLAGINYWRRSSLNERVPRRCVYNARDNPSTRLYTRECQNSAVSYVYMVIKAVVQQKLRPLVSGHAHRVFRSASSLWPCGQSDGFAWLSIRHDSRGVPLPIFFRARVIQMGSAGTIGSLSIGIADSCCCRALCPVTTTYSFGSSFCCSWLKRRTSKRRPDARVYLRKRRG